MRLQDTICHLERKAIFINYAAFILCRVLRYNSKTSPLCSLNSQFAYRMDKEIFIIQYRSSQSDREK